ALLVERWRRSVESRSTPRAKTSHTYPKNTAAAVATRDAAGFRAPGFATPRIGVIVERWALATCAGANFSNFVESRAVAGARRWSDPDYNPLPCGRETNRRLEKASGQHCISRGAASRSSNRLGP